MSNSKERLARQSNLSPARRAILAKWMQGKADEVSNAKGIAPRSAQNHLPLSFAQQRLWFLDQLEPGNPSYNICVALHLSGPVVVAVLERSLKEVVRRHESLRTTFRVLGDQPVQVIGPAEEHYLSLTDLSALNAEEGEVEAQQLVQREARLPFDLTYDSLLRNMLLRLGEDKHILLLTMHHIISDGWSMDIFLRELAVLYNAFVAGQSSALSELPVQYADFALWQREWLQGEALEDQLCYWREHLSGLLPLNLPTDHPRPAMQTFSGAHQIHLLPASVCENLKRLSQREGVTLFMTLLTSFQVLLARYTGQTDIAVGTPVTNRSRPEIQGLIGLFVNTLVMRTDLSGNPTFRELLGRVREVALGAFAHQDMPFNVLVAELQPERNLSHSALFQVLFSLQNAPVVDLKLADLTVTLQPIKNETAKFDLSFELFETGQGLSAVMEYNTDLFEASTIRRMLGHWQTILEGIVAEPESSLAHLPLLSASERRQLLLDWNATQRAWNSQESIVDLFACQVARRPDALALVFQNQGLTYAALQQAVWQVTSRLQRMGLEAGDLVGVCLERGLELVIGLLAILQAGGAYVPLDPSYPAERLSYMLQDSQARLLLSEPDVLERLPPQPAHLLSISQALAEQAPAERGAGPQLGEEQLVYVIYTSGSTGRPKGTMIAQGAVSNFFASMARQPGLDSEDVVLAVTAYSFDIAALELLLPLTLGARIELASRQQAADGQALAEVVEASGATVLQATPATWRLLLAAGWMGHGQLKMLCGGEALPRELAEQVRPCGAELWNMYGPTETTIWSALWQVQAGAQRMAIGRGIANTQLYVLDAALDLVPIGVVGELYIGGAGLAHGYWQRPELTAERFVPDPFSQQGGGRLYRTGDQVRWLAEGSLEYVGRADQQIKLRGHRIELGEIEAVLSQQPGVQECVVVLRGERLVAYVVGQPGAEQPARQQWRQSLREQVPEYMVPAIFVPLEALPRTPNGKIDRRGLPVPQETGETPEGSGPRTPVEELIGQVWAEVLGREQVSVQENFFEQGGHSLLATQVLGRLRARLGVEVPLRSLFEGPTIGELAQRVEQAWRAGEEVQRPVLQVGGRPEQVPLSFAQQRLWFLDQLEPGSAAYNIPLVAHLQGTLAIHPLERSLIEIVQRHESLRTTFQNQDGQAVQVIDPCSRFCLLQANLRELETQQREIELQRLLGEDLGHAFNLSQGPLVRGILLWLADEEHVLLLTTHHIISDGWSNEVLVRELSALYTAFAAGQPSPLPALPIQYADFALWQQQWLQGAVLARQLAYWTAQLREVPPLDLPTDHPRPAIQTFHGSQQSLLLPAALQQQLTRLSHRQGVTLFMTLLAAFQVLLARYSGQHDIAVGTPIANRTHHELEGLIGFFVNTLVLRSDLSGNPSFVQLLARVREVALSAYAHQDVPFEKIVEVLQPQRDLSRSPLFQVMLIVQNGPQASPALAGVRLSPLSQSQVTAKFDLTLEVHMLGEGLWCGLEYNSELFEAASMRRMLGHWQSLLEGMVAQPDLRLSDLPLLTWQERRQLQAWNDTEQELPRDACVHQLIEMQVERTPDAIAVSCDESCLSYHRLNHQANTIAHFLGERGIGPEMPVAVFAERSIPFVLAMLAISKANGVYLPLDPLHPASRLRHVLMQTRCSVVLVTSSCLPQLRQVLDTSFEQSPPLMVVLETLLGQRASSPGNLPSRYRPDHLAYIIYTSGSTGQPKGVMVEQEGMLNHMLAKIADTGLSAADIVAQIGPQGFDVSVWQSLAALMQGGQVEIVRDEIAFNPACLLEHVQQRAVTLLQVVPSMLREMLVELSAARGGPPELRALRWLIPTGDALARELCEQWFEHYPHIPLLNTYGATECSDDQCHYAIIQPQATQEDLPIVPLGFPIPNMRTYVLDQMLNLVPVGVRGELYLGGVGVGRGYLNEPARTAEAFVPDPFDQQAGCRLYKTGDVVRRLADGNLEFVGRSDHLVKVAGYRIEPGDIEAILAQHPGVHESIVIAWQGEGVQDKQLVAYVVTREPTGASAEELRTYLRGRLPDYMVPLRYMWLEALPLNANGKVDRRALPAPDLQEEQGSKPVMGIRNQLEEVMAMIWSGVLGREQVETHDNFFALGGHSLLATKVIARLRAVLGVELPLRSLFETPTIVGLSRQVERMLNHEQGGTRPPIEPISRAQDLPLSFAQQRLWFLDQLEPGNPAYNIPGGIRLQGTLVIQALERSLTEIVQRHESLRTTFRVQAGQAVQIIEPRGKFCLPQADMSGFVSQERERELRRLVQEEAESPFNLTGEPLFRGILLRLSTLDHVLLLTMHHIVSDGWSMEILLRELTTLYRAFLANQPSPLQPIPVQYADFAVWQRQRLRGEVLNSLVDYWTKQLRGAVPLEMPTDRPRSKISSSRGAIYTFTLPAGLSKDLLALSRREGVTLFMTVLAAFQTLLYRWTGQQDIVVGTDIANRTYAETEEIIGFFVNLLVLRTQLSAQDTFREVLRRVSAMLLNAYAHQDLPFEKLIEALQLERTLHQIPLVNVLFVLQNTPPPPLEFQGLVINPMDIENHTAKFDLAVFMVEREQELIGFVNYRTDLFDSGSIGRLFDHFNVLLQSIVVSLDTPVEALEMYTEEEKEQRLNKETMYRETHRRKLKAAKRNLIALPGANGNERDGALRTPLRSSDT